MIDTGPTKRKAPMTVVEVNALRSPGRHSIGDGLILVVNPSGSRAWLARFRDATGRRLAKRDDARTLATLRAEGLTPEAVRERLGFR